MEDFFTARVQYSKNGLIRFIGHLDTGRLIKQALRCSGLLLRYTQGFSPHIKVSFGPPLPLGFSSDCEFFDASLEEVTDPAEIKQRIQPYLPNGLVVEKTAMLTHRPSALARIIDHAQYRITLPGQYYLTSEKIEKLLDSTKSSKADDAEKSMKMRSYVESLQCVDTGREGCVFEIILKDVNKSAPSIKKIFAQLLEIELFEIDGAQMHRLKLWSNRQNL